MSDARAESGIWRKEVNSWLKSRSAYNLPSLTNWEIESNGSLLFVAPSFAHLYHHHRLKFNSNLYSATSTLAASGQFHFIQNWQTDREMSEMYCRTIPKPWALKQLCDLASALQDLFSIDAKYRHTHSMFLHLVWPFFFPHQNTLQIQSTFISTVPFH